MNNKGHLNQYCLFSFRVSTSRTRPLKIQQRKELRPQVRKLLLKSRFRQHRTEWWTALSFRDEEKEKKKEKEGEGEEDEEQKEQEEEQEGGERIEEEERRRYSDGMKVRSLCR